MSINNSKTFRLEPSVYDPEGLITYTIISVTNCSDSDPELHKNFPLLPKELLPLVYGGFGRG